MNCIGQQFLSYLVCCLRSAPGFRHAAPAGSLLRSQCCNFLDERGRQDSPVPRLEWKGHLSKGWTWFPTQKETHCKRAMTFLTLFDNTMTRQHMVPGGQGTQPPLDGGVGSTVQECWELVLQGFETLMLIPSFPKGLYGLQGISSGMEACEDSHGQTWQDRGMGRVVCQNGQVCLREDIQHGRDVPTGHRGGKTSSDQRFLERCKKIQPTKRPKRRLYVYIIS